MADTMTADRLAEYVTVNERIIKFYEKYPNGRINTHLLEVNSEKVILRATVYRDATKIVRNPVTGEAEADSTGYAEELRAVGFVNKTSAVENGETSAVGRALALLGFEIKKGIASREEVQGAIDTRAAMEKPMTAAQEQAIYTCLAKLGITPADYEKKIGRPIDGINLADASEYIGKLKTAVARAQAEGKIANEDRYADTPKDQTLA